MTTSKATLSSKIIAPAAPAAPEAPAPTVLTLGRLPREVQLSGMSHVVFAQAVVLARAGYVFDDTLPQRVFPETGLAFVYMTLGTPEAHAILGAKEATEEALAKEQRDFERLVEEAATRLVEERAAAAVKAEAAAKIAAAEAELAAMRAAATA